MISMTTLIFIRHGETPWSRTLMFKFRGRIDIPLTELGILQAKAVGLRLQNENISTIYSSPLLRAHASAEEIAKVHNLQVIDHNGFIDLDFGTWQGELHSELQRTQPELYTRWLNAPHTVTFPKGETLSSVRERVEHALAKLVTQHKDETIAISTHGAVLRVIFCFLHDVGLENYWKFGMDNCALSIAKFEDNKYSILAENDNEHLIELSEK